MNLFMAESRPEANAKDGSIPAKTGSPLHPAQG
jgi:hypothetical protein